MATSADYLIFHKKVANVIDHRVIIRTMMGKQLTVTSHLLPTCYRTITDGPSGPMSVVANGQLANVSYLILDTKN